jgi:hypothetical protein
VTSRRFRIGLVSALLLGGLEACSPGGHRDAAPTAPVSISTAPSTSSASTTASSPESAFVPLDVVPPGEAMTCAQAATHHDPALLVAAFRAARLLGHGAEGCLTAAALSGYDDADCTEPDLGASPGPMVLYRCGSHRVVDIQDRSIQTQRSDPSYVVYEVTLSGLNEYGHQPVLDEHIEIGPGIPVGRSQRVAQVIIEASQY